MNDIDSHHDGVVELGMYGICNVFSMCSGRAVQTHVFTVGCVSGEAKQRLDTETQIEHWPPLRYRAWPPTPQNF